METFTHSCNSTIQIKCRNFPILPLRIKTSRPTFDLFQLHRYNKIRNVSQNTFKIVRNLEMTGFKDKVMKECQELLITQL